MGDNSRFSLTLQKQIAARKLALDCEIHKALQELGIRTLLNRCGIVKQKGFQVFALFHAITLLPFMKKSLTDCWLGPFFKKIIQAQKDTFYRFLNHERFNWRKLVKHLAVKIMSKSGKEVPLRQKTLIADDTLCPKTGKAMEMVSYHFDHKTRRTTLGYQCLQLGCHDGVNFYPLDAAFHTSASRPNDHFRDIDRRTHGGHRRQEALRKKTDVLVEMIQRAWNSGIDAAFVLFDSWFAHDAVIAQIHEIGYGVICRLKRGHVKYRYEDQSRTVKQLWQTVAKKKTQWMPSCQVKGVCLRARLPKAGPIQILFVSDGKKQWHAFLCTDLELSAAEILEYYARRWAVELFFKDAKQMLYLGKEQSHTFEAIVACYSLVMIRYLLLVYILQKGQLYGPMGPLFRDIVHNQLIFQVAEQFWQKVKERLLTSSQLISYEIEPEVLFLVLDIIEDAVSSQLKHPTAKL